MATANSRIDKLQRRVDDLYTTMMLLSKRLNEQGKALLEQGHTLGDQIKALAERVVAIEVELAGELSTPADGMFEMQTTGEEHG